VQTPTDARDRDAAALPQHVEATMRSIIEFHAQHVRAATPFERAAERVTSAVGRPAFVGCVIVFVVLWTTLNLNAHALHFAPFDAPPFSWLQGIVSLTALCLTALVLSTQRRLDRRAEERAQLTLQVALVGEQKTTKIIQLLEELRTDHPEIVDRHDPEAAAMSESTDPRVVLDALRETHDDAFASGGPLPGL